MKLHTGSSQVEEPSGSSVSTPLSGLVLIVDDEPLVRRMLRRVLERMGLEVIEAKDGFEAIELFKQFSENISVILLDWSMPRMNGKQTLQGLRACSQDVPVFVLSGAGVEPEGSRTSSHQVQAFLKKPFRRVGLESHLRSVLV